MKISSWILNIWHICSLWINKSRWLWNFWEIYMQKFHSVTKRVRGRIETFSMFGCYKRQQVILFFWFCFFLNFVEDQNEGNPPKKFRFFLVKFFVNILYWVYNLWKALFWFTLCFSSLYIHCLFWAPLYQSEAVLF